MAWIITVLSAWNIGFALHCYIISVVIATWFLPAVNCWFLNAWCHAKHWGIINVVVGSIHEVPSCCCLLRPKYSWCLQVQHSFVSWHIRCLSFFFLSKQDQKKLGLSPSSKSYSVQQRTGSRKKQSKTLHKSRTPTRGHMQQRVHPGMSSSQNRTTAHYGAVTGLRTTTDGMHLLSSGWVNLFSVILPNKLLLVAIPEISMERTDDRWSVNLL